MAHLPLGQSLERRFRVTHDRTAAAIFERDGADQLQMPAVWSTPDMIAMMEAVAAVLVATHLDPGQITVGARNEVNHLAATPEGMEVRVRATLAEVEGRKLTFAVEAYDPKEKVGEGTHIRYVVDGAKFAQRLAAKQA